VEPLRRIRQLGVEWVLSGGPPIPWDEARLKEQMDRVKAAGLNLGNLMITGFNNAIFGRPGRDEEIEKVIASVQAAGKVGLPVVEYNWYAHRATEGYFDEIDDVRTGVGWTSFDYELARGPGHQYMGAVREGEASIKFRDLPPLPNEGAHSLKEMWETITYFLKKVIPEAEKAGVRLALHPNDPPAPISRGSQQIMGSVDGWKHLIEIVKSPSNGITFDCGVTREMGENPVEVCTYFLVMKELVKHKYPREIYPEHPRALDYDRERGRIGGYPGGGGYASFAFQVGYARAMMQAALMSV